MKTLSTAPVTEALSEQEKQTVLRRTRRKTQRTALAFWGFMAPLAIGLIVFFYVPILWGVVLSFGSARATIAPSQFVGLQNYIDMLRDPDFTNALGTFTIFAVIIVPLTFISALGLALLVNTTRVAQAFFRSVFFIPTACSYVLASIVWKESIFNGIFYGLANTVLHLFGHAPIQWISSPNPPWFWLVLATVRLWLQIGIYMIIFIAGLQDISQELYEAAFVDGAKKGWQTFWSITFPLLRNASISVLLLLIINAFQAFDEFINIMTGGNQVLARPPLVYLYNVALTDQDYGHGSAGGIILTLIIVVFTLIQGRLLGFGTRD